MQYQLVLYNSLVVKKGCYCGSDTLFNILCLQKTFFGSNSEARWGVAEWIERPLLMLEVRGSNPGPSASKNTTSLPRSLKAQAKEPGAPGAPPDL